jgi:hypothetical protein
LDIGTYDNDQIETLGEDAAIIRILKKLRQTVYDEYKLVAALSIYNKFNPNKPFSRHVNRLIKILSKSLGTGTMSKAHASMSVLSLEQKNPQYLDDMNIP